MSCKAGNGHRLAESTAAPLVMTGLVTEQIGKGRDGKDRVEARILTDAGRALADACEAASVEPQAMTLFDLGAPDLAALRRIDDAKAEAARRRSERAKR